MGTTRLPRQRRVRSIRPGGHSGAGGSSKRTPTPGPIPDNRFILSNATSDGVGRGEQAPEVTLTVHVPLRMSRRGGRKIVMTPNGSSAFPIKRMRLDNVMVKALARAHRWKRMMESGDYASVAELAAAEKVNQSYLCRVLRLTLLAPEIVEAILHGRPEALDLRRLMQPVPALWREQAVAMDLSM